MLKKWVLPIVLALGLLGAFSQAILDSPLISEKITDLAESKLKSILGEQLAIRKAGIHLFSATIVFNDFSFHPDQGPNQGNESSSFSAKEIRVSVSPGSFFTEAFLIRKIEIDSPVIQLVSFNPGEIPFLKKTKAEKRRLEGDISPVIIRTIQIKNGRLAFKEGRFLKAFSLAEIECEINMGFKMNRVEINFISKKGYFLREGIEKNVDHFEGEIVVLPDRIDLKKGHIVSGKARLLADGTFSFRSETPFDFNIDLGLPLEMTDLSGLSQTGKAFFEAQQISGDIAFSGKLTGSVPDPVLEGKLVLSDLAMREGEIGSARAALSYRKKKVALSALSGKLFSGVFSGNVAATLPVSSSTSDGKEEDSALKINLRYKDLPMDQLLKVAPFLAQFEDRLLKGLFVTGDLNMVGSGFSRDEIRGSGEMTAARLPLFSPSLQKGAPPLQQLIALFQDGRLNWNLSSGSLMFSQGEIKLPKTALSFQGKWDQSEGLAVEASLTSEEVGEVAEIVSLPLTGRFSANGMVRRQGDISSFKGGLVLEAGRLRGRAYDIFASEVDVRGKEVTIKTAMLNTPAKNKKGRPPVPAGHYLAKGKLDLSDLKSPQFDFEVEIKSGDPQDVLSFFKLKIPLYTAATGRLLIQGVPKSFSVKGPLVLSSGLLYGEGFDEGSVALTVTRKEVLFENVVLSKKKSILSGKGAIRYDKTYWLALKGDRLQIKETGFLKWLPPSLTGSVGLSVSGRGSFKHPQVRFVAAIKSLQYSGLRGVRGTIKADWVDRVVDFESDFPDKNISISGEVKLAPFYPFSFEGTFNQLRIDSFFEQYLSGPVSDVTLQASGKLTGSGKLFKAEKINLSGRLTELTANFGAYQVQNDGPLEIHARQGLFSFKNTRLKGENTALVLNGDLTLLKEWDLFIKGEADLNLITFFSQKIASGRGKAILDLAITDQWKSPRIRGELNLKEGNIRTVNFSQPVQISALTAIFNERQVILENLRGKLGGGHFFASGKASLAGFGVGDFGFLLEIEKVRIHLTETLPATLNGDLFFQKTGSLQTLKGDLVVKNVIYEEKVDLGKLVSHFIQQSGSDFSEATPIIGQTKINIHLYGKEEIWIDNNLAKIPLVIDLLVKGSFDDPRLIGRVDLSNGSLYFRDNTFKVIAGSVDFLNPEQIDPVLDLTARANVRNIITDRNYDIDVALSGTLSQLNLTWHSFPQLPEADILALLAIGKTTADLAEIKGGAGTEATNFVVTEFLAGPVDQITGLVGEPVEKITGVDHIRVDPYIDGSNASTTAGTRLTVEKRLMEDRLVVIYSTTLDPSEEELIRMVYEVNKHISLVGKRDTYGQVGGDIRFRFQFR